MEALALTPLATHSVVSSDGWLLKVIFFFTWIVGVDAATICTHNNLHLAPLGCEAVVHAEQVHNLMLGEDKATVKLSLEQGFSFITSHPVITIVQQLLPCHHHGLL